MMRGLVIDGLIWLSILFRRLSQFLLDLARGMVGRNIKKHSDGENK